MFEGRRRFLIPLVAVLSCCSRAVQADLQVGTFFGANWNDVENEVKSEFRSALADVRSNCAADATCAGDVQKFCGYQNDIYYFDEATWENFNARHLLDPHCDVPHFGPGCFMEICLKTCFSGNVASVSQACIQSRVEAEVKYELLHEVEELHDGREMFFRFAVTTIILLSMVASYLVILLSQEEPDEDESPTVRCAANFCVGLNWVSIALLLGFVVSRCPQFLVIIVPPFALVHLVYYAFFHSCDPEHAQYITAVPGNNDDLKVPLMAVPLQIV